MNWKIGMLIQAYQNPAHVSCGPESVADANQVAVEKACACCQT